MENVKILMNVTIFLMIIQILISHICVERIT